MENLRVTRWRLRHRHFLLVFNWHQVTPAFDPGCHYQGTWTKLSDFDAELDYLASEFQILPLTEAVDRLKHGSLRGPCAALSFDDGDLSMAEHVQPLLHRRHLPATFFINTAYLDASRSYWFPILEYLRSRQDESGRAALPADLLEKALQLRATSDPWLYNEVRNHMEGLASLVPNLALRLVSTQWLSTLDGDQFTIGAHGHEHQRFSMMSVEWQQADLRENVRLLSQFRAYRPIFAVPFGQPCDWNEETLRIAQAHGLDVVLASRGINVGAAPAYHRISGDSRILRPLVAAAMGSK